MSDGTLVITPKSTLSFNRRGLSAELHYLEGGALLMTYGSRIRLIYDDSYQHAAAFKSMETVPSTLTHATPKYIAAASSPAASSAAPAAAGALSAAVTSSAASAAAASAPTVMSQLQLMNQSNAQMQQWIEQMMQREQQRQSEVERLQAETVRLQRLLAASSSSAAAAGSDAIRVKSEEESKEDAAMEDAIRSEQVKKLKRKAAESISEEQKRHAERTAELRARQAALAAEVEQEKRAHEASLERARVEQARFQQELDHGSAALAVSENRMPKCCLCLTTKPAVCYEPCRHVAICVQCEEEYNPAHCPLCAADAPKSTSRQRVYGLSTRRQDRRCHSRLACCNCFQHIHVHCSIRIILLQLVPKPAHACARSRFAIGHGRGYSHGQK